MHFKDMWALTKDSASAWSSDYAPSMGAALSYYTLFSIAPLLIIIRLEEFSYPQAAAIGTAMLMISFGILLFVHLIQAWQRRRFGRD